MNSITTLLTAAALAALVHQPATAGAATNNIVFTGGGADLTFYYNSTNNTWATVFRAKGTTNQPTTATATGLTAPFNSTSTPATWTGIVGNIVPAVNGNTGDYTFTSLNPVFNTTSTVTIGQTPTTYFVSAASQSPFTTGADLGIRTRLRENQIEMGDPTGNANFDQFATFNLTLNTGLSTFNGNALTGNANVSLLHWDALNTTWTALLDTANNETTAEFDVWDHVHRNWGFSKYGNYSLVFDLVGVGGAYGGTASAGSTSVNFEVVPEPSTYALLATALGLGALLRRRFRR
jgi:surface-anchored protein